MLKSLSFVGMLLCLAAVGTTASFAASRTHRTYRTPQTPPLRTAVFDPFQLDDGKPLGYALIRKAGASYVRLSANWGEIAPITRPDDFEPGDPNSPGYTWSRMDAMVEAAHAAGLTPMIDILTTPAWAYANPPSPPNAGSPKTTELRAFAHALATHYDGEHGLPDVRVYQVWNEPNLSLNLDPATPAVYRGMINAVADGVHSVDPTDLVVAGELDPFGHAKSGKAIWYATYPFGFMRSLLCLSKGSHPHATCDDQVHFDVWSHHPYTFGGPFARGKSPANAELGDLPKMRALLRAAVRLHHVVSSAPPQFWVTEFGWDTKPPRYRAAPVRLAARWTSESMYQAWRSGITLFTWFDLEDLSGPGPYKSGLYFHASSLSRARPKLVLTAFRFPFVAYLHGATVSIWGRDTTSDQQRVTIQRRHGKDGRWRTVGYITANSSGIFQATMRLNATKADWVRALAPGSRKALAFSLAVPHPRIHHIGPWGG